MFTLKSLHSFCPGIPRMLIKFLFIYVSSAPSKAGWRTSLLRARSLLLTAANRQIGTRSINGDFWNEYISADLNGLYSRNAVRYILEGKELNNLDSMFPFVADFVDRAMGEKPRHPITHVYSQIFGLRHLLSHEGLEQVLTPRYLNTFQHCIQNFRALLKNTFDTY